MVCLEQHIYASQEKLTQPLVVMVETFRRFVPVVTVVTVPTVLTIVTVVTEVKLEKVVPKVTE